MSIHILPTLDKDDIKALEERTNCTVTAEGKLEPRGIVFRLSDKFSRFLEKRNPTPPNSPSAA